MPELIVSIDINIALIEDTIFNEAKRENKWVEAALVKVPIIARLSLIEKQVYFAKSQKNGIML